MDDEVIALDPETLTFKGVGAYRVVAEDVSRDKKGPELQVLREALPDGPPGLTYKELEEKTQWDRRAISRLVKIMGEEVGRQGKPQSKKDPLRLFRSPLSTPNRDADDTTDTDGLL